ncbi:MAG TPA: 2-isopropylmalate synthase [Gammaproteobacteria bacterium]|nr:2-isopropylmalate synthase [Gammaproteobacteria bacterium]
MNAKSEPVIPQSAGPARARFDHRKYRPYRPIDLTDRTWPGRALSAAPDWCSVDLRDGNQALVAPMSVEQKLELFALLVDLGFTEIEIGFPSASQTELDFTRRLIENGLIPDHVTVQVLTQARKALIDRTFEALAGVPRAIVHVYNSTSPVQREQVFGASREEIIEIAVDGARWVREEAARRPETEWVFQYSPESFSGTEPDYAVEVCNAVLGVWRPQEGQPVILNLPATVEMTTPNVFADQIEYFCRHVAYREHVRISLHTHNDRGCAVAAAELGILAGADRVEGTLFGNGERTGNMDILTMAMNLYSQGIDPRLDLADMAHIVDIYSRCTSLPVDARHPWAGELVYAAFSGSHQDAIRKSMHFHRERELPAWNVAYLPIDPADIGRRYEEVVRINSQSGKGGVALVLERDHGIALPKWLHPVLSGIVQREADASGREVSSRRIRELFETELLSVPAGWRLCGYDSRSVHQHTAGRFQVGEAPNAREPAGGEAAASQRARNGGGEVRNSRGAEGLRELAGEGQGLVEALIDALNKAFDAGISVVAFEEHAVAPGTTAYALASVIVEVGGRQSAACSMDEDSAVATLQAVLSAAGRALGSVERSTFRAAV